VLCFAAKICQVTRHKRLSYVMNREAWRVVSTSSRELEQHSLQCGLYVVQTLLFSIDTARESISMFDDQLILIFIIKLIVFRKQSKRHVLRVSGSPCELLRFLLL